MFTQISTDTQLEKKEKPTAGPSDPTEDASSAAGAASQPASTHTGSRAPSTRREEKAAAQDTQAHEEPTTGEVAAADEGEPQPEESEPGVFSRLMGGGKKA